MSRGALIIMRASTARIPHFLSLDQFLKILNLKEIIMPKAIIDPKKPIQLPRE